jgi:hypothetical protein
VTAAAEVEGRIRIQLERFARQAVERFVHGDQWNIWLMPTNTAN